MKEEVKVMELDKSGQGVLYVALKDLQDRRRAERQSTASVDKLIRDLCSAPVKMREVRSGEAR